MHRSSDTIGTEELYKQLTVHTFVHHTQHTCVIRLLTKCSSSSIWKGHTLRCSSPMPCRWKFASKRYEPSLTLTGQQPPTQGPAPATARVGFYWLVNVTDSSTRSVCLSAAMQQLPYFIKEDDDSGSSRASELLAADYYSIDVGASWLAISSAVIRHA